MSSRRLRLGWALGVSVLLHAAVLLLLQTPPQSTRGDSPISVLIQREPAAPAAAPPDLGARAKPERKVERDTRKTPSRPVVPAPALAARGPSMSVTAGPISKPLLWPDSQLADAATYIDAERLAAWPKLVGKIAATYPARAYERRRRGVVVVQLMVDESGTVAEARALAGPDEDLIEAALAALRPTRFRPAVGPEGRPARARVFFEVSFVLE